MLEAYFLAISGIALAQASPGPNFLAVVGVGMSHGRRRGFATLFGIAIGMMIWAILVAIGLGSVLAIFPKFLLAMKLLGGLFLLYLGYKSIRSAVKGSDMSIENKVDPISNWYAFKTGLLVIMTNPKAALMWAAVASFLFGSGLNSFQVALSGPLAAVTAFLIYGGYLMVFTSGFAMKAYNRFSKWIEAALGATFGVLGASLLLSGLKETKQ